MAHYHANLSDYLLSNVIICIHFWGLGPFERARAEIQKCFHLFLVQVKTLKFASEIY